MLFDWRIERLSGMRPRQVIFRVHGRATGELNDAGYQHDINVDGGFNNSEAGRVDFLEKVNQAMRSIASKHCSTEVERTVVSIKENIRLGQQVGDMRFVGDGVNVYCQYDGYPPSGLGRVENIDFNGAVMATPEDYRREMRGGSYRNFSLTEMARMIEENPPSIDMLREESGLSSEYRVNWGPGHILFPRMRDPRESERPSRPDRQQISERAWKLLESRIGAEKWKQLQSYDYFTEPFQGGKVRFLKDDEHGVQFFMEVDIMGKKRPLIWNACIQSAKADMPEGDVILARWMEFLYDPEGFVETCNFRDVGTVDEYGEGTAIGGPIPLHDELELAPLNYVSTTYDVEVESLGRDVATDETQRDYLAFKYRITYKNAMEICWVDEHELLMSQNPSGLLQGKLSACAENLIQISEPA